MTAPTLIDLRTRYQIHMVATPGQVPLSWMESLNAYIFTQHDAGKTPEQIAEDLAFMEDPDILGKVNIQLFGVRNPKDWLGGS